MAPPDRWSASAEPAFLLRVLRIEGPPGQMVAPAPIQQSSPIEIGSQDMCSRIAGLMGWLVVARQTAGPIITRSPSVMRASSTNMQFVMMSVPRPMRILDP